MNENLFLNPTFLGIIISALIAVVSWFIIAEKNKKHEIFKKQLDYKIEALKDINELFNNIQQIEWRDVESPDIEKIGFKILICGSEKEIKSWGEFFKLYQENKKRNYDITKDTVLNDSFYKTWLEIINVLRKEMGVENSINETQFKSVIKIYDLNAKLYKQP